MGQNCGKNTSELLKTHQNSINSPLNTTKDQSVPEKTEYDDYIVKQAGILYKNQKVSPEEINLRYDALKRKDIFKEIDDIKFNTFVAYRHSHYLRKRPQKICGSLSKKVWTILRLFAII